VDDRDRGRGRRGTFGRVTVDALVVAGGWLVLAGTLHVHDLAVAVGLGAGAAAAGAALRRYVGHRPAGLRTWVGPLPAAMLGTVTDTWTVTRALARRLRGAPPTSGFVALPFEVGDAGAGDATRRAAATLLTTLQPNSYVVGFDRTRGTAIVHQLEPTDDPPIAASLRARP
jgi:multisubunit Na+/H+ antiporter MnhE subunit